MGKVNPIPNFIIFGSKRRPRSAFVVSQSVCPHYALKLFKGQLRVSQESVKRQARVSQESVKHQPRVSQESAKSQPEIIPFGAKALIVLVFSFFMF